MKDIINEVLLTEKRVEDILQKARLEASDIKLRTEKEAAQKIAEARNKAREIIQNAVEKAEKKAVNLRDRKLKEAVVENEELINKNRPGIDAIVEEIVELIISTVYEQVHS